MALRLLRFSRKLHQPLSLLSFISQKPNFITDPQSLPHHHHHHHQTLEKTPFSSSTNPRIGSPPPPRKILEGLGHNLSLISSISTSTSSGSMKEEGEKSSPSNSSSWIDLYLPKAVRPYALLARLDKTIGTWLLAWPCMWSITMAATPGGLPDMKMLALFGCGAVLLRGAGCTVNDLLDRDIDVKVQRTKCRPCASGTLTGFQGLSFLGVQLLLGLGILLQLNNYSVFMGVAGCKRQVRGCAMCNLALMQQGRSREASTFVHPRHKETHA